MLGHTWQFILWMRSAPSFSPPSPFRTPRFGLGRCRVKQEVITSLPLPWTTAVSQLGIGLLLVFPGWLSGVGAASAVSSYGEAGHIFTNDSRAL